MTPLETNKMAIYIKNVDNTPSVLLKCLSYKTMSADEMVEKTGSSPYIGTCKQGDKDQWLWLSIN
jgi:hypothetical protein